MPDVLVPPTTPLAELRDSDALLDGHFRLSSGLHADRYVQCALALQRPDRAGRLARALAAQLPPVSVDVVLGPALGGVVVAHELARALGVRAVFAERDADRAMQLRRGFLVEPGERVLVAEDVVTTGRSALEAAAPATAHGGTLVGVACLVDRRPVDAPATLDAVPLHALVRLPIAAWPADACPLCATGAPLDTPGSRHR